MTVAAQQAERWRFEKLLSNVKNLQLQDMSHHSAIKSRVL